MTTTGIYKLSDVQGTCLYLGQSRTVELRWKRHLSSLRAGSHKRKDFVAWFKEAGSDSALIKFQVLEELPAGCSEDQLNEREIHWFHVDPPMFYGKLPSLKEKWQHSEETKNKIRASAIQNSLDSGRSIYRTCPHCTKNFLVARENTTKKFCSQKCVPSNIPYWAYDEIVELHKTLSLRKIAPLYNTSHVSIQKVLNNTPL